MVAGVSIAPPPEREGVGWLLVSAVLLVRDTRSNPWPGIGMSRAHFVLGSTAHPRMYGSVKGASRKLGRRVCYVHHCH
jgi:hypothetical protein